MTVELSTYFDGIVCVDVTCFKNSAVEKDKLKEVLFIALSKRLLMSKPNASCFFVFSDILYGNFLVDGDFLS